MTFLPIVDRELRVRARQPATYQFRLGGAVVAILVVGFLLGVTDLSSSNPSGSDLFGLLAGLALAHCLLEGTRSTADCLSEEKRAGTLGLLFLTDLRGYDIVLGKLIATSLNSFYALLAVLPPLAIPLVLGGVTAGEFWRMVLVLMVTLGLTLATGLAVATVARSEGAAWGGTLGLMFVLASGPVAAFWLAFDANYPKAPGGFWGILWLVLFGSGLLVAVASATLPRVWRDSPKTEPTPAKAAVRARRTWLGETRRDREALLARNPALWLGSRGAAEHGVVWALTACGITGAAALWYVTQGQSLAIGTRLLGALAWHLLLGACVAWLACRALARARGSGVLELVLGTPLRVEQLCEGFFEALRRVFLAPALLLFGFSYASVFAEPLGDAFAKASMASLAGVLVVAFLIAIVVMLGMLDLWAVSWFGLWMGLRWGRPGPAVTRTVLFVLVLPLLAAFFCLPAALVVLILKNFAFMSRGREQLQRRFRAIVAGEVALDAETPLLRSAEARPPALPNVLDG